MRGCRIFREPRNRAPIARSWLDAYGAGMVVGREDEQVTSTTLTSDRVAVIWLSRRPDRSNRARYSYSVRSRPPVMMSMLRSMNLLS